jgi:hypothetical protein
LFVWFFSFFEWLFLVLLPNHFLKRKHNMFLIVMIRDQLSHIYSCKILNVIHQQ